ncbi:thiol-disulfide oxidoreductase DCC family protein [Halomonas sp. HNIBRBA4712]|uniref:thiol-disulfide oxidoreductase DCC family protein n=1 Tax=Halomonas sp. HNIBRBA4712 TaxID=3373087 RepID=UPI003745BCAF
MSAVQENQREPIRVFYDARCPLCRRERRRFERLAGRRGDDIAWCDVTEHEQTLAARGVSRDTALRSLHIELENGRLIEGIDAYRLLMKRIPWLVPGAYIIGLPGIKQGLRRYYDHWVEKRLKRQGRWSQ